MSPQRRDMKCSVSDGGDVGCERAKKKPTTASKKRKKINEAQYELGHPRTMAANHRGWLCNKAKLNNFSYCKKQLRNEE